MNLILIGYRATGKTTVARLLAERLGWKAIDSDDVIEKRAGKTTSRIFAEDGEPAFRDLEAQVIAELCQQDKLVLASGGGAPLRPESRKAMRDAGKVVWLTARPETIHARMNGDALTASRRPSLTGKNPWDEILLLLQKREPIYRETAHLEIDSESGSPETVAAHILAALPELNRDAS